ncbi:MAG TPA: hypothetical protein VGG11_18815 [Xanthobacteraceae bacterium]|jgi:hypothetical protein
MFGAGGEFGTSALKLWLAVGSAVFLVSFYLLVYSLPQYLISRGLRAAFVILGGGLGAVMAWALLDATPSSTERRALELRAEQLNARPLAPGSALACLDPLSGEAVEAACEKVIFASPASVAAATSFVAERLDLLSALLAYGRRGAANVDDLVKPLRRTLEADRFGFLAHVLAVRDGCTGQDCKALALLDDSARVRANLSVQTFDRFVEHYADIWAKPPDAPIADAVAPAPQPPHKMVNIDFPTASSIPAVSIMNPEPTGPVLPGMAAAAAANPNPQQATPPAARRARKAAANAASPQAVAQPVAPNAGPTEPIWPEPVPAPPGSPGATASSANAPVQIAPPLPGANTTVRTQ